MNFSMKNGKIVIESNKSDEGNIKVNDLVVVDGVAIKGVEYGDKTVFDLDTNPLNKINRGSDGKG